MVLSAATLIWVASSGIQPERGLDGQSIVNWTNSLKRVNLALYPIWHRSQFGTEPNLAPSKSEKSLYTGIYLPTFREGTHSIIKPVVVSGALTGPRESPPFPFPPQNIKKSSYWYLSANLSRGYLLVLYMRVLSDFEGGSPRCILGQTPLCLMSNWS